MPSDDFSLPSHIDDVVLSAYLAGTCTPSERAVIETWVAAHPRHRAFLDALRDAWTVAARPPVSGDVAQFIGRMDRMIAPAAIVNDNVRIGVRQRSMLQRWIVAMTAVAIVVGGVGRVIFRSHHASPVVLYRTAEGERKTFTLRDGSTVILAPATVVQVETGRLHVSGNAYFTVISRHDVPFTVETDNAIVHVLGTKFDVRHYPAERASQVMVEEGKISLQALRDHVPSQTATTLAAHMTAQVSDSGIMIQRGVASDSYVAWTRGTLVFTSVPLREIIPELSRAYAIDIQLTDSVLARQPMTLTASVHDMPIADVLDHIAFTVHAHIVRGRGGFVILPGPSTQRNLNAPSFTPLSQQEKYYGR